MSSINLVAHELAHQWWGDLVTCKDWGELWLNEGFATYFATLWTEEDEGIDEAIWQRYREAEGFRGEDASYRRSIVNYKYDTPNNMFDGHSYPKAGRVLHMLRYELGDEMFWRSLRHYTDLNQFRTVETANLRIAIEEATGAGMNWFFDQWLYRGGYPEFTVDWSWDDKAKDVRVTIKQTQPVDAVTPLFRTSVDLEIALPNETQTKRVMISKADETFHFHVDDRPTRVCFDPEDWILKKLTFNKSKEELMDQLARDKHVVCRVQAVQGLTDNREEPLVAAALLKAAQTDSFWAVRQEAVKLVGRLNTDAARTALIAIAKTDAKAVVRREAVSALGNFPHDDVRQALRDVIAQDHSYFTVAEALRKLLQIDRDHARDALLAAFDQTSQNEVILRAACDGLIELKDTTVADRIGKQLEGGLSPERRGVLLGALARMKPGDAETLRLLHDQLDNKRREVRRAAIESIVALGDAASIAALQSRRAKEQSPRGVRAIDEAITKLRDKQKSGDKLQAEIDALKRRNEELEQRLKNLEAKGEK
ncbi:MAG: M1 family aminopeptidase [Planctomycetota bacterium]|nr:M1 family aminopeptidase [Planctomycetota bacterium]